MPDDTHVETIQGTDTSTVNQGVTQELEQKTQTKSYSEDEVRAMIQAEADRRVSQALAKEKAKAEEALMVEQGKFKELYEKQQKEIEQANFKANAQKIFLQKQVPELADVLMNDFSNIENLSTAVDSINSIIEARVLAEVEKRLSTGKTVITNTTTPNISNPIKMTREQYLQYKKENNLY